MKISTIPADFMAAIFLLLIWPPPITRPPGDDLNCCPPGKIVPRLLSRDYCPATTVAPSPGGLLFSTKPASGSRHHFGDIRFQRRQTHGVILLGLAHVDRVA